MHSVSYNGHILLAIIGVANRTVNVAQAAVLKNGLGLAQMSKSLPGNLRFTQHDTVVNR